MGEREGGFNKVYLHQCDFDRGNIGSLPSHVIRRNVAILQ